MCLRRFIILSTARTGSNLLVSLLRSHPNIKVFGEFFNLAAIPQEALVQTLNAPLLYMQQRLNGPHDPDVSVVGFKLFYDHLTEDYFHKLVDTSESAEYLRKEAERLQVVIQSGYDWPTLEKKFRETWHFLAQDRSFAILHLKRRNMLDSLVSLKTAVITGQWWTLKDGADASPHIHLDPQECRHYFEKLDLFIDKAEMTFREHRKLDVDYERLVAHQQEALRDVFEFLEVPWREASTRLRKQRLVPPSECIVNYDELKKRFTGTKWGKFFA